MHAFAERDLSRAGAGDAFFGEFGIGNVREFPLNPYERFQYYRDLLIQVTSGNERRTP